jgi:hypothetical protein
MALAARSITEAKQDGHTSRATRFRKVAKAPGAPITVSQRTVGPAVGVLSIVSLPLTSEGSAHLPGTDAADQGLAAEVTEAEQGSGAVPNFYLEQ